MFNSGAFYYASKKGEKEDNIVYLEHGKPLIFGKSRDKGVRLNAHGRTEVVELSTGISEDDLLFHDENDEKLAFLLSRMNFPEFPEPMGVFHTIEDECYENLLDQQVTDAKAAKGEGDLHKLFNAGDTWTVE